VGHPAVVLDRLDLLSEQLQDLPQRIGGILRGEAGEEGGTGLEVEALFLEGVGRTARSIVALAHRDPVAVARQQRRAAEPCEPGPDDDEVGLALLLTLVCHHR